MRPARRRLTIVLLALVLQAIVGLGATAARADSQLETLSQDFSYSFAHHLRFTAEFRSQTPITQVTLLFAAEHDLRVFSADLPVAPDQTYLPAEYTLDLTEYPLRPFVQVSFWWYVETAAGVWLETTPVSFSYTDNRYEWHQAEEGSIRVHWVGDDPALGHSALRMAIDGLERIQAVLPGTLLEPVDIYIYPSQSELTSALRLTGQDWIAGHADPEWGVILVNAGSGPSASVGLQSTIPHEVAHLVIHQTADAFGKQHQIPRWLHEGLAVGNEPMPDPAFAVALEQARSRGTLLSFETLCGGFPVDQAARVLAYAQSADLVRYLQNQYGNHRIRELLEAYADGADCSGGVARVLGITLGELQSAWQGSGPASELPAYSPAEEPGPWLLWAGLIGGSSALASTLYVLRPRPGKSEVYHRPG